MGGEPRPASPNASRSTGVFRWRVHSACSVVIGLRMFLGRQHGFRASTHPRARMGPRCRRLSLGLGRRSCRHTLGLAASSRFRALRRSLLMPLGERGLLLRIRFRRPLVICQVSFYPILGRGGMVSNPGVPNSSTATHARQRDFFGNPPPIPVCSEKARRLGCQRAHPSNEKPLRGS